ncbi:MAG: M4 family peptidase [Chitinophagaceae bacterium]|nr:MAG: M4 family peptidase [Chitinophagaceae bacterium]
MKPVLHTLRGAALLLSLALPQFLSAQTDPEALAQSRKRIEGDPRVQEFRFNDERQTPSMIMMKARQGVKRTEAHTALAQYLGVRSGVDDLQTGRTLAGRGNLEVLEFAQYYRGIKVDRAGFKALVREGLVAFYNGAWYQVPDNMAVRPSVDRDAALSRAKSVSGGRRFAWDDLEQRMQRSSNASERAALQAELASVQPGGELVIIKDFGTNGKAQPRLAWKFNVYAAEPLFRAWIYIDASDGHTLLVDKIIKHVGEEGERPNPPTSVNVTVQTRYAGAQVIKTKQVSGNDPNSGFPLLSSHPTSEPLFLPGGLTWALIDDSRGNGIETYDMNGVGGLPISVPGIYLQGKSFTDQDNNWTLAEHKRAPGGLQDGAAEAENDDIAWDAHWGAGVVYDYWLAKHNRLSFDGNNAKIKSFIHYGPAYDNAFWNGSAMTYGDGSGPSATGFKALTSLDVCGHEIGHGVCSFTSDLVYASESGAMNEGLSDIWAACIEHFAMVRAGSTVPTGAYRPFYIGEQIGANADAPLRRMDNPKDQGNPDTYGGDNWEDPACTPTLANDQCGVHTNSGVLNHWFFLLTAGSLNGTRPAGLNANWYYRADSDDEMNDLGNSYRVNGVGFDQSEQVTFLMETMLTSNATYAEARETSIQVATAITGDPCSGLTQSVTNAWYAVGVGAAAQTPCTVRYGFVYQPGQSLLEATGGTGCTEERIVNIPVLIPAMTTVYMDHAGTATYNVDWTSSVLKLTNNTNSISKQNFIVRIFNDGVVENDETINLLLRYSRALSNPVNNTFAITILDDDAAPVIGTAARTLLSESFTRADGFADPDGWQETLETPETTGDPLATGQNQWGIFNNKLSITGKDGLTGTQFPAGTYNSNSESRTRIRSPRIDARGLGQVSLTFDYSVQGEVDVQSADPTNPDIENLPVFDYMAVAYSLDGVNFIELGGDGYRQFASVAPASGSYTATLPPSLANKQFYLAFRWVNDGNAGGPVSVSIDNLHVSGSPRQLENDMDATGGENLYPNGDVYIYSYQDGQVMARVKNNSTTKSFRCTAARISKAGSGTFTLYADASNTWKVSDKIVRLEPAEPLVVSTTVTLFYTEAQLAALEAATGKNRQTFQVFQVNNNSYLAATSTNTRRYNAVYTEIPGVGASYTVTFTYYLGGYYALGARGLATTRTDATKNTAENGWSFTPVFPNPGRGTAYLGANAPEDAKLFVEVRNGVGQVISTQEVAVSKGSTNIRLNVDALTSGNYRIQVRTARGELLHSQNYFRN